MRKKYRIIQYINNDSTKVHWSKQSELDSVFAEAAMIRDKKQCNVKVVEYTIHDSWEFKIKE